MSRLCVRNIATCRFERSLTTDRLCTFRLQRLRFAGELKRPCVRQRSTMVLVMGGAETGAPAEDRGDRTNQTMEIRRVGPDLTHQLHAFLKGLQHSGDDKHFHPHSFDFSAVQRLCEEYCGRDLYYVLMVRGEVAGYGMLRGWDEGYAIPSLGIALSAAIRGKGLGTCFMHFLHAAARLNGAERVRLKVYRNNIGARRLYSKLGYIFAAAEGEQDVGTLVL